MTFCGANQVHGEEQWRLWDSSHPLSLTSLINCVLSDINILHRSKEADTSLADDDWVTLLSVHLVGITWAAISVLIGFWCRYYSWLVIVEASYANDLANLLSLPYSALWDVPVLPAMRNTNWSGHPSRCSDIQHHFQYEINCVTK